MDDVLYVHEIYTWEKYVQGGRHTESDFNYKAKNVDALHVYSGGHVFREEIIVRNAPGLISEILQ